MGVVRSYEVFFILSPRQSRLLNVYHLTKKVTDLPDQEVQNMLGKDAIVVLDPEKDHFLALYFLCKRVIELFSL